jgi:hypothetical protein
MIRLSTRHALWSIILACATLAACSSNSTTPATPTTPTSTTSPTTATTTKPSLAAPVPVSPLSGATVATKPVFTVTNAVRTGTIAGAVTYTFDVADNPGFSPLAATGSAPEGAGVTTFTLTADLGGGKTYYWRAAAIDVADGLTSPASASQTVATVNLSTAAKIASQEGLNLWPGTQPPGTPGQANLGDGWGVVSTADFMGNPFVSPTLENLRVFDLLDRGMNPNSVLGWMNSNGYNTSAVYYDNVAQGVFGFSPNYMTLIGTYWSLVRRVGA